MNLKKIIREEVDDFDWATGYQELTFKVGDRVVVKNVGSRNDYIQWLGGHANAYRRGLYGENITGTVIADYIHTEVSFFVLEEENTMDQITVPYKNSILIKNFPNLKLEYYLLEDEKNINESEDDLDWIREITPTQSITELKPGDRYRIVEISGGAEEEYYRDDEMDAYDPYQTIFKMDSHDNFVTDGNFIDEWVEGFNEVWVMVDEPTEDDGPVGAWLSVNTIIVTKI